MIKDYFYAYAWKIVLLMTFLKRKKVKPQLVITSLKI